MPSRRRSTYAVPEIPSPFRSVHGIAAEVFEPRGLNVAARLVVCAASYRLIENFTAVFAFPNRSYTAWNRGARSLHFGRFVLAGADRAGTKRPAGTANAESPDRSHSLRRPALTVSRFIVQVSIA